MPRQPQTSARSFGCLDRSAGVAVLHMPCLKMETGKSHLRNVAGPLAPQRDFGLQFDPCSTIRRRPRMECTSSSHIQGGTRVDSRMRTAIPCCLKNCDCRSRSASSAVRGFSDTFWPLHRCFENGMKAHVSCRMWRAPLAEARTRRMRPRPNSQYAGGGKRVCECGNSHSHTHTHFVFFVCVLCVTL